MVDICRYFVLLSHTLLIVHRTGEEIFYFIFSYLVGANFNLEDGFAQDSNNWDHHRCRKSFIPLLLYPVIEGGGFEESGLVTQYRTPHL